MADISDAALEEALNIISNAESCKSKNSTTESLPENDQLDAMIQNMEESFANEFLKDLNDIDVSETNNMIESVLGELVSKDLLYEPFMCMKTKIENEIKSGNSVNEKGLGLIKSILEIFDRSNSVVDSSDREKLMHLIYELQEQGDLWQSLSAEN